MELSDYPSSRLTIATHSYYNGVLCQLNRSYGCKPHMSSITECEIPVNALKFGQCQALFLGKVYYLTQSVHGKKKFRFGFRFFYLTTDILNVNPDVFTLSYSREKNESMEDGNIGDEARYKMCV